MNESFTDRLERLKWTISKTNRILNPARESSENDKIDQGFLSIILQLDKQYKFVKTMRKDFR